MKINYIIYALLTGLFIFLGLGPVKYIRKIIQENGEISWSWFFINMSLLTLISAYIVLTISNDIKNNNEGIREQKDIEKVLESGYLVFENQTMFDNWQKKVAFNLGLPKYGRNAASGDVDTASTRTTIYTQPLINSNTSDKRIACLFDEQVPAELISKEAQEKYGFIKATFREIEEMGFINDSDKFNGDIEIYSNYKKVKDYNANFKKAINEVDYNDEGFMVDIFLKINYVNEQRNKYIMDLGLTLERNRVSIYLDKKNRIVYRIIDSNGVAYNIKINSAQFKSPIHLKYCVNLGSQKSINAYINNALINSYNLPNNLSLVLPEGSHAFLFSNLDGQYNGGAFLFYASVLYRKNGILYTIVDADATDKNKIIVNDGYVSEIR